MSEWWTKYPVSSGFVWKIALVLSPDRTNFPFDLEMDMLHVLFMMDDESPYFSKLTDNFLMILIVELTDLTGYLEFEEFENDRKRKTCYNIYRT